MGGMMGGQSTKPYGYGSSMGSGGGGAMGGIMAALTAKQQKKYGKQASKHGMGIEQFLQKKTWKQSCHGWNDNCGLLGYEKGQKNGQRP